MIQNPATHDGQPSSLQQAEANQGSATKWIDVTKMRNWYELSSSRKAARVSMNMFACKPRSLEEKDDGRKLFSVKILERHPFTPQTFVPVGLGKCEKKTSYLVIVAPTLPLRSRKEREDHELEPAYPVPPRRRKRSLRDILLGARPNPFTNDFTPSTTSSNPSSAALDGPRPKGPGLPDLENIRAFMARGDQAVTYGAGTWHAPMVVLGDEAVDFVVVQYANGVPIEDCQEIVIEAHVGGEGLAVDLTGNPQDADRLVRAKL